MNSRAIFAIVLLLPLTALSADDTQAKAGGNIETQARAIPTAEHVRANIEKLSGQPHLAGTPGSKAAADWIAAQLREYGLATTIETFDALLPVPKVRVLEMTAPVKFRAA